jgi:hypothetical protein
MEAIVDRLALHHLAPVGSSIHMAVATSLIAKLAKVDLEHVNSSSSKSR